MTAIKAYLPPHTTIGESPLYRPIDNTLHYIDVRDGDYSSIHVLELSAPFDRRIIPCPEAVASINFGQHGGYIVCTFTGIAKLGSDGRWVSLKRIVSETEEEAGRCRLNDSAVDCKGRLWVGGLDVGLDGSDLERPLIPEGYRPTGSLYRYDPDGSLHTIINGGLVCSNGIGWTPDHKTMFHTDSFRQTIWAYDFDAESGAIHNRRVHIDRSGRPGEPDGLVVDTEGNIFTFIWEGSVVEKYNTSGCLVKQWKMNAYRVTHGAWVGEEMDQLIVTTARGMVDDEGGGLFWLKDIGSKGMERGIFG